MSKYKKIKEALDNPEELGLKQHFDLIMEIPQAKMQEEIDNLTENEVEASLLEESEKHFAPETFDEWDEHNNSTNKKI